MIPMKRFARFALLGLAPLVSVGCSAPAPTEAGSEATGADDLRPAPGFFFCALFISRAGAVATRKVHTPYRNGRALLQFDEELPELGPSEPVRIKLTYDSTYVGLGVASGVVHDLSVAYSVRRGTRADEWSTSRETLGYIENFYGERSDGSLEPVRPGGTASTGISFMEFCSPISTEQDAGSGSVLVN